jgi:hypothetical protein
VAVQLEREDKDAATLAPRTATAAIEVQVASAAQLETRARSVSFETDTCSTSLILRMILSENRSHFSGSCANAGERRLFVLARALERVLARVLARVHCLTGVPEMRELPPGRAVQIGALLPRECQSTVCKSDDSADNCLRPVHPVVLC